jgi:hypothetical protein
MKAWRIPEDVVFRDLDGEGVVLNLATGTYFGLNPTATRVWHLIQEGKSSDEIVGALVDEFEVTDAAARADVSALLDELTAKGLVSVE